MVRFIITRVFQIVSGNLEIYIPIWLDLLFVIKELELNRTVAFTFQYG